MGKPESKIETYFVTRCEQEGIFQRKVEWIARRGCPDRYARNPRFSAWVECKSAYGELHPLQVEEITRMRAAGDKVFVVASKDDVEYVIVWFKTGVFLGSPKLVEFSKEFDA